MWGIIQSILVVFALFAFLVAIIAQLAYLGLHRYLSKLAPERRARQLVLLACSPVVVSVLLVILLFIPSFMTLLGLTADHCLAHGNHHEHFCFIHPPAFIQNPWTITFSFIVLVTTIWRIVQALGKISIGQHLLAQLRRNCHKQGNEDYRVINTDQIIACSMGFIRPEIFISHSLKKKLSKEEIRAVIAHEQAHTVRKDFLKLFLAKIFSAFFIPKISKQLLSDINLASEQACDLIASKEVNSSTLVARTIVKVQKLMPEDNRALIPAMHFSKNHIVQRVMLLMDHDQQRMLHQGFFPKYLLMATVSIFLLINYKAIHHYVETLYFTIFQ